MRMHHVAKASVLLVVVTAAAILVPTPAAAHAHRSPYKLPNEQAMPITGITRFLPPLNRGTVAAVLHDRDLERFGGSA